MDKIREMLGRLKDLTSEELTELRGLIVTHADEIDAANEGSVTVESSAILAELAKGAGEVQAEGQAREAAQAEADAAAVTAREAISGLRDSADSDDDTDTDAEASGDDDEAGEDDAEGAEAEGAEAGAEAVAAGGGRVKKMAAAKGKKKAPARPETGTGEEERNRATLTASGAMRGFDGGKPIEKKLDLARGMADTLKRMNRDGKGQGDVICASASWQYPEDRILNGDPDHDAEVMENVIGDQALVATGGICTPVNVDYGVPTWATADRPLRDGLPSFQATRGGIRYVQPPDIAALAAATGIWTSATDANPGAATKAVMAIACGSEIQVLVDAIPTRLQFGNMQGRFAPEQVAANTDLAMAAAARIAENNILNKIAAASVAGVTTAAVLGATRDYLVALDQATAAYRSAHRLPRSVQFTVILPDWFKEMIRADMAREIGHAQDSSWNSLMISDAQIEEMLSAHNVRPIWHIDGQPSSVAGGIAQVYGIQTGTTTALTFPSKMVWYLFPEGQIQFLDGGRLDLGVVRDATLDATNDYETFVETFEAVAFRGFASGAVQYVSTLCANGQSSGTAAVGSCA